MLDRALIGLGRVLHATKQDEEAVRVFRQAIDQERVASERAPEVMEGRNLLSQCYFNLSQCLRSLGRAEEAARVTRTRRALWTKNANELYNVACELALCVPITPNADQQQSLAAEAVQMLDQAIAAGWNNAHHTSRDPDLVPLHDRDDFRRLLAELFDRGFPNDPFTE
jgi:hypothetical protein